MVKKFLLCLAAFLVAGVAVYGISYALGKDEGVSMPQTITADSPCPVVYCASGECHGFGDVPEPDGVHEMTCPEAGCADAECHAWDTLQGRYKQASDASMNIWILAPVALVVGLVLLVGALSRPRKAETPSASRPGDSLKGGGE